MVSILTDSVKQQANREKLKHYFFLENRQACLSCPRCKKKTDSITIGGRSSYFCPGCQKPEAGFIKKLFRAKETTNQKATFKPSITRLCGNLVTNSGQSSFMDERYL